ncbi:MAG: nucleotide exchange factor GrpE [Ginsengibacter sp.]
MKKNTKEMTENDLDQVKHGEDQSIEETEEPAKVKSQDVKTAELETALQEQKDKYIRLFAEFDNYRRRTSKENIELAQTAGKDVIISLLEVLDDMDRAEEQVEKSEDKHTKEGVLLVFNKLRKKLENRGLKAIETLHTNFDVEKDEAISEMEVSDNKLKGKVVAEVEKGYLLNDKLIRHAKVVVGK